MGLTAVKQIVAAMYDSWEWKDKVYNRMPARQVYAIYRDQMKRKTKKPEPYHQITIWEWMEAIGSEREWPR